MSETSTFLSETTSHTEIDNKIFFPQASQTEEQTNEAEAPRESAVTAASSEAEAPSGPAGSSEPDYSFEAAEDPIDSERYSEPEDDIPEPSEPSSSGIFGEDRPFRRFSHARREEMKFLRDKWILSRISDDQLLEYLKMEEKKEERLHQEKELRNRRLFLAFQMIAVLAAVVAVVYLLKDNPAILVNILYIGGFGAAFYFWKKQPHDKED